MEMVKFELEYYGNYNIKIINDEYDQSICNKMKTIIAPI